MEKSGQICQMESNAGWLKGENRRNAFDDALRIYRFERKPTAEMHRRTPKTPNKDLEAENSSLHQSRRDSETKSQRTRKCHTQTNSEFIQQAHGIEFNLQHMLICCWGFIANGSLWLGYVKQKETIRNQRAKLELRIRKCPPIYFLLTWSKANRPA